MMAKNVKHQTLESFQYDGRRALQALLEKSEWRSIEQAVASLTMFAHQDVVSAVRKRAVFRIVRDSARRGRIDKRRRVMFDDNRGPTVAFLWATLLPRGKDLNCNHLYTAPDDEDAYTDLRNICFTPSFLAKLTDNQRTETDESETISALLRYRAWKLYGYGGPRKVRPPKPKLYDELIWAEPLGERPKNQTPRKFSLNVEQAFRRQLGTRPCDRVTKSVHICGWTFSKYKPDKDVKYGRRKNGTRCKDPWSE